MFIIGNVLSCISWGALVAIVVTGIVWFVYQSLYYRRLPLVYLVLLVLFVLTGFQATIMVGAIKTNSYVDDIADYASTLIASGEDMVGGIVDFEEQKKLIADKFPMVKPLLDTIDTSGLDNYTEQGHTTAEYFADTIHSMLNSYIWRRVWWMSGFIVAALLAITMLPKKLFHLSPETGTYSIDYSYDNFLNDTIF